MADIISSMGGSQDHYDENNSYTKEYILYVLHLYEIMEQAERIYGRNKIRRAVSPEEDGDKN